MKGILRFSLVSLSFISLSLAQSITITRPNGGESWPVGDKHPIHWNWNGNISSVKIEYSVDGGINWILLASSTPNDGDYLWTIPNMVSSNCFVKISDVSNPSIYDISDASFYIARPVITIEKPNGGEIIRVGDYYPIQWKWTGEFNTVKIEYSTDGGSSWATIINSTTNDGDYYWQTPNIPSLNYRVKVTNNDDPNSFDISDNNFIVDTNTITVISPDGGEAFVTGKRYPISWDWTGSFSNVKIEYSIDGGNTWNTVIASTPNDGSHYWTIPNTPSNTCKIKLSDVSDPNVQDISNNNFSILSTGVEVLTPDGGEQYVVGDEVPIHWNWTGSINNVKIEYSVDGGTNWNIIVSPTTNDGDYLWTVPNTPSNQVKVKITNVDDANAFDISASNFTIRRPSFWILRPDSTEDLIVGETYPIHWNWRGYASSVKLELAYKTETGVQWWTITASTPNDGSHYFVVPNFITDSAWIKITNNDDVLSYAIGEVFQIVHPTITVIFPNGGENFVEGEVREIIWDWNGDFSNVMLQYSVDGGNNWLTITTNAPNTGSYKWTVPNTPSNNCLVKVINTIDIQAFDISDTNWTIGRPNIYVIKPVSNETFWTNQKHPIYWQWDRGNFANVKIDYSLDGGNTWTNIILSTQNKGYYLWDVDPFTSSIARLRVINLDDPAVIGVSDTFTMESDTLLTDSLKMLSPIQGETYVVGGEYYITWKSISFSPDYVNLYYSTDGGVTFQLIGSNIPNSPRNYLWTVPTAVSNNCVIKIEDVNLTYADTSEVFSIIPQELTIISPTALKEWIVGRDYYILWKYTGGFANAVIEYSYNGGTDWVLITSSTPNDGEYKWTIPNTPSTQSLVRIKNFENENIYAISDTFTIKPQQLLVTSPKRSDSLIIGRKYFITWDYTGNFSNVNIEYSVDGGSTWNTIVLSTLNNQRYQWTIPNTPSSNALVRVLNSANPSVQDISDTFYIAPQQITVVSPFLNDQWIVGRKYYITWWNTGVFSNVKLEYSYDGGISYNTISASSMNSGSYEWTIPNTPSDSCLVKISNVDNASVFDISDTFRIPLQTITITSPKVGDNLLSGRKYYITWDWTGTFSNVDIEYSTNNGSTWNFVQTGVQNNGSYEWTIPTANSDSCRVRLTNPQNLSVRDISDLFSILPQEITVISPVSSDTLFPGRKYNITWRTKGSFSNANLEYSIDGGQNWLVIVSNTLNNGHYEWTVPEVISTNALIKISNSAQPSVYVISDTFTIAPPLIEITSPLLGDAWFSERKYYITWNILGAISQINLYYSLDQGTNWTSIVLNSPDNGNYEWTIPSGISSDSCRIKLSSSANNEIYGISDSFAILPLTSITEKPMSSFPERFFIEEIPPVNSERVLLKFGVPQKSDIFIKLYDVAGRVLMSLSKESLSPGYYSISLKENLPLGVYILRFEAKNNNKLLFKQTRKVLKF